MGLTSLQLPTLEPRRLRRRIIGLALASLVLHVWVLYWANTNVSLVPSTQPETKLMQAALRPTEPQKPIVPAREARKPVVRAKPKRPSAPPPPAAIEPSSALPSQQAATPVDSIPIETASEPFVDTAPIANENAGSAQETSKADQQYKFAPPPSAELKYDVQALRDGQTVYGGGKIGWQFDGARYVINGEAGILFITVLTFGSEGDTDAFGIAPVIYREKRFRRSETNTHFQRERQLISFSSSTLSYPRKGGEQDRASIIWQLAALGRGDREKFAPNSQIPIFVAGVRDGEVWNIQVIGEEEIDVGIGKLRAWHVTRTPRQGSYEQKLDIWLAPEQNWYPVRLRFTEVNGDYLDMSLSSITATQ